MRTNKSYRFDDEIIEKIKAIAEENHRSLTNQIEVILIEYLKQRENGQI